MGRYTERAISTEFIYQGEEVELDLLVLKATFEGRKAVWTGMLNTVLNHFWSV